MYNTYIGSTLSLRCKGSLSFSFNDYSYFLNDRFDRNPQLFSSQSCCSCYSSSGYRESTPISPSYLYGFRQSALIQCSASRRLILGGGDRYYCRFTNYDVGRSCCCGFVKERGISGRRGRLGEERFRCMVSEEKSERHRLCDVDDVEVMLSLLTEEAGEECFGVGESNVRSSRRVEVEKRGNRSGSGSATSYRTKRKNVTSGLLESKSKCEFKSVDMKSREVDYRQREEARKEEKESRLTGERHRNRKGGSSCSSYYSCTSLGELESDTEVQVRQEGYRAESASGFKRDSEESGEVTYDGKTVEEVKRHGDVARAHGIVMRQEKTAVGSYAASSGVECDWRKKSEKKLTEDSIEQMESWEKSRESEVCETSNRKNSTSHHIYDGRDKKTQSIDNETRQQYSQKDDHITGHSGSGVKYKHFTGVLAIHDSDKKAIHTSEKHVSGQDNLRAAGSLVQETRHEHTETAGHISRKDEYERNSLQLNRASKIQEIDDRGTSTSQRQSEARVKKWEDKSTEILSSVHDTEEHHHLTGQWDSRQMDSKRKFQGLTKESDIQEIDISSSSVSLGESDTRMRKQDFIFGSSAEAKMQHIQTGGKTIRKTESRKGSQDKNNASVVYSSDAQLTASQRDTEMKISSQETYTGSVVQSTEQTIERNNLTEERVTQIGSINNTQKPITALCFREGITKEASSSQASLVSKSQPTVQHIGVGEGDTISSQAVVIPPPSQLVARGPLHVEPTSGSDGLDTHAEVNAPALRHEIYGGARSTETHEEPLNFISHEDALGSSERMQNSSTHYVGEFIEKVTEEVSSSEVQIELVNEGRKHQKKSLSQYGSGDFKSKEHSRRSSRSSGVKGPSDDVWDVTDPSIQEPSGTEVPESATPTTKTIAKRTGRSLWNIISDIVRLRWSSHSESHISTQKSGGRSSPNQSASSEAWFSGHEADEISDENVRRGKDSTTHISKSANQHHLVIIPTGSQGEVSSSASSKDKIGQMGVDAPSSSSISGSGSASLDNSLVPTEENFRSGTAVAESSVSMPSLRLRRSPHVDESSEAGKIDVSGSGSLEQELPSDTGLTGKSVPEGKDGELKQRMLQRNSQVPKDRFDEWEEAYKLESEQRKMDEMFMREALLEAKKAADMWEVPVGAVLVQRGKIIARGCNLVEELRDSTAHAEMICIREASSLLRTWRLSETTLYVTLEPCPMCAGAILQARVDNVVWGAPNKLLGADGSWIRLFPDRGEGGNSHEPSAKPPAPVHPFHPKIAIRRRVLEAECADTMQQFFQRRRKKDKKLDSPPPPPPPPPPSCLPISHHPSKLLTKMHDAFHFMFCL